MKLEVLNYIGYLIFIIDLLIVRNKLMNRLFLYICTSKRKIDKLKYADLYCILKSIKPLLMIMLIATIIVIIAKLLPIK
jgi:hypothetical protein